MYITQHINFKSDIVRASNNSRCSLKLVIRLYAVLNSCYKALQETL